MLYRSKLIKFFNELKKTKNWKFAQCIVHAHKYFVMPQN